MGRELQKRKNRSSFPKVRHKPKSKLKVISNPIIAANWDKKATLSQNYRRLGLVSKLNKVAGGTESRLHKVHHPEDAPQYSGAQTLPINPTQPVRQATTEVQVERDPETGAILRVLEAEQKPNPLNDALNELDEEVSSEDMEQATALQRSRINPVVRELEMEAACEIKKAPRKQSQREDDWVSRLVAEHGDDYDAMFWDKKLNPMQQSRGDLKRRVKKWRERRVD